MESCLEIFLNEKYKILKVLYNNQIKVKEEFYIPLSQQEIADLAHFSKLKTNKILNELIGLNFVVAYQNKRGKYALTERSYKLIDVVESLEI